MTERRWLQLALIAVVVGVVLFALPHLVVLAGGSPDVVGILSAFAVVALGVAFVLLVVVAAVRTQWTLVLAGIALVAEVVAALLLLIREPQPAYLHPEWAWYWPVVNTFYVGGLLVAIVAILGGGISAAVTRSRAAGAALLVAVAALAVCRVAPYR